MKLITLTVLAVMIAFGALAQPPKSSPPKAAPPADAGLPVALGSVYHDFMERFADENPAWKTEISLAADITRPPSPPYRLNYSDTLGYYSYRVKRWDDGTMVLRWVLVGVLEAARGFRRLKGHTDMNLLVAQLKQLGQGATQPAVDAQRSAA